MQFCLHVYTMCRLAPDFDFTLHVLIFSEETQKYIFIFYHSSVLEMLQLLDIPWNPRSQLSHIVNTMAADDLATRGARASAAMVLTKFSGIFWLQHQKG